VSTTGKGEMVFCSVNIRNIGGSSSRHIGH
jgi:hypothetical protein